jgi:hypothetical protein
MDSVNPKPREPQPGLGRVFVPDARDRLYPMAAALPVAVDLPRFRYHSVFYPPLNQGSTSQCVLYSTAGLLYSSPQRLKQRFTPAELAALYFEAQDSDEWPGREPAYYGTSVRAGFKMWQAHGYIESYYHAQSMADLERWTLTLHPWIAGTNWYASFYDPDPKTGVIKIKPGAQVVGGHAYCVVGYNRERGVFTAINSWGEGYGLYGRFRIEGELMERLVFQEWGDAVGAVEVAR